MQQLHTPSYSSDQDLSAYDSQLYSGHRAPSLLCSWSTNQGRKNEFFYYILCKAAESAFIIYLNVIPLVWWTVQHLRSHTIWHGVFHLWISIFNFSKSIIWQNHPGGSSSTFARWSWEWQSTEKENIYASLRGASNKSLLYFSQLSTCPVSELCIFRLDMLILY